MVVWCISGPEQALSLKCLDFNGKGQYHSVYFRRHVHVHHPAAYSMEAPQVQKPGQVRPDADRARAARRFLADLRCQRPADVRQGSAVFKNASFGGSKAAQFRAEIYNLFNQVAFQDIDRTARFDANGVQINPNFGTAIGISNPTRPPRAVQLQVRFNF
jgi:hypothetical protein